MPSTARIATLIIALLAISQRMALGEETPVTETPSINSGEQTAVSEEQEKVVKPSPSTAPKAQNSPTASPSKIQLAFNFKNQPWPQVLEWFAEQADLSLVSDTPPTGTFNYADAKQYDVASAMDLLNSILLTKGYTLVRRERMLMVVNLEDGIPPNLVTEIPLAELDSRGEYEIVRVVFPIRNQPATEAASEIEPLIGPQGSVISLPRSGQIRVTETGGRLRLIRDVLAAADDPTLSQRGKIHRFQLEHASVDDVLPVVRQLLGIQEDSLARADGTMQLAIDRSRKTLFAQGNPGLIDRIEKLLPMLDALDPAAKEAEANKLRLQVYPISGTDPAAVLQVLQSLLAGDDELRLATDPQTGNLVAYARGSQHVTIQATLDQMQRTGRRVEVVPLGTVEPHLAVLAIARLFGGGGEEPDPRAPKVDADAISNNLLIRATGFQIEQIKDLLAKLGTPADSDDYEAVDGGPVRMIPLTGSAARRVIEQLEQIWPAVRRNPIRVMTPSSGIPTYRPNPEEARSQRPAARNLDDLEQLEQEWEKLQLENPAKQPQPEVETKDDDSSARTNSYARMKVRFAQQTQPAPKQATTPQTKTAAPIVLIPGPNGLVIASDDEEALDHLEQLIDQLSGVEVNEGPQYAVYYLRYATASTVSEIVSRILGGGGASPAPAAGGSDPAGGMLDDLLGFGGGSGALTGGSIDIVPDTRLNALIVHANAEDLDMIEELLEILDQPNGPNPVESEGRARIIPILNTSAEEVAQVISQVFSARMQSGGSGGGNAAQDVMRMLRSRGRGGQANSAPQQKPSTMSVAVDARSNSIVVRAPDALFAEVKQLVEQLDAAQLEKNESMRVINLRGTNSSTVQQALSALFGDQISTSTSSGNSRNRTVTSNRFGNNRGSSSSSNRGQQDFMNNVRRQLERNQRSSSRRQSTRGGGGRGQSNRGGGGGRSGRGDR